MFEPVTIFSSCFLDAAGVRCCSKTRSQERPGLFREPNQIKLCAVAAGGVLQPGEGEGLAFSLDEIEEPSPWLVTAGEVVAHPAPAVFVVLWLSAKFGHIRVDVFLVDVQFCVVEFFMWNNINRLFRQFRRG